MTIADDDAGQTEASETAAPSGMACDFCGDVVPNVRRVALDGAYDRIRTPHKEQYACPTCSARKENQRLGHERT